MTHTETQPASTKTALAPDVESLDERSRRAWTERMAVRLLPDGRYAVDSASGATYVVDLRGGDCTCPDSEIRGALCKHVRRVAIEINQGRVRSPAGPVRCRLCDSRVPVADEDGPPWFCADCALEPGDVVYDRERDADTPLLVVAIDDRRADEVTIDGSDLTVAEYGENRSYSPSDPVVEVVYPRSVHGGAEPRRYSFPASRLAQPDPDDHQTTLAGATT